jgi:hypothetical protein
MTLSLSSVGDILVAVFGKDVFEVPHRLYKGVGIAHMQYGGI